MKNGFLFDKNIGSPCMGCEDVKMGCKKGCYEYLEYSIIHGSNKSKIAKKRKDSSLIKEWVSDKKYKNACKTFYREKRIRQGLA